LQGPGTIRSLWARDVFTSSLIEAAELRLSTWKFGARRSNPYRRETWPWFRSEHSSPVEGVILTTACDPVSSAGRHREGRFKPVRCTSARRRHTPARLDLIRARRVGGDRGVRLWPIIREIS
jgi:hypothetical protein